MQPLLVNYLIPFVQFLSAIFILCYSFKKEQRRLYLIVFFVVVCVVRWFM